MALPVSSKSNETVRQNIGPYLVYLKDRSRTTQRRPYNLVLPARLEEFSVRSSVFTGSFWGDPYQAGEWYSHYNSNYWTNLDNEAFEKLKGRVYSKLQLANDVIEGGQTFRMVANAGRTLVDAARALARGDLKSLKRLLNLKKDVKFSNTAKSFGAKWLELHFGWSPLLEEIHSGLELYLSTPPVYEKFSASATRSVSSYTKNPNMGSGYWTQQETVRSSYTVKAGLVVQGVRDKNLFTLEQLGLTNPAAIAWEAVPYSFFVDYILNVGDVLASYTAFSGLSIGGSYTTHFFRLYCQKSNTRNPGATGFPEYKDLTSSLEGVFWTRSTSLPVPTLSLRSFKAPSKTRLATVGSLLTQFFRK